MAESYEHLERKYQRLRGECAALRASHARLLEALKRYEAAREGLLAHCLSNGVFNAWGAALDCSTINDSHLMAREAIAAAQPFTETNHESVD